MHRTKLLITSLLLWHSTSQNLLKSNQKLKNLKNHPLGDRLNLNPKSNHKFRSRLHSLIRKKLKKKSKIEWENFGTMSPKGCKIPKKKPRLPVQSAMKNCISASYDAMLLAKEFAKISTKAAVQGRPVRHGVNSCMRNLASSVKLSLTGDCYNRALNRYFDKFMGKMKTKMTKKGWVWDNRKKIFSKGGHSDGN